VISLKKTIEAYDYRSMWQAAFDSYLSAIQSLRENAVGGDHEGLNEYRTQLQVLKSRLETVENTPATLRSLALDLDGELKRYRFEVEGLLKESTHDLKDVVAVLAEATESLSQRDNQNSGQLSRISGGLEAISQLDDLAQVRITLNRQVSELRSCISRMAEDNESAIAGLQREISGFQRRLEKVQVEASTDPLTGVANRRRCTREITSRIQSRNPFGIILLDLNKFKQINDSLGHAAGDSVLRLVAQNLLAQLRPGELACRWGGDEFVVVRDGPPDELAARGKDIANRISGRLKIQVSGADHELAIGGEFGWAGYRDKETAEDLFARADKVLYDTKAPRLKIEAPVQPTSIIDSATGLRRSETAEVAIAKLDGDLSSWFLGCFAIRSAAKVNNHYGFPATDSVLPFLRDELRNSKFAGTLFRGRGASILALVKSPAGLDDLEQEVRRICAIGLEKNLKQKRRASILPVAVGGKVFPVAAKNAVQQANAFIDLQRAADQVAPAIDAARGI
jgi:diguanylate cyclase